jgi:hypothetical protein
VKLSSAIVIGVAVASSVATVLVIELLRAGPITGLPVEASPAVTPEDPATTLGFEAPDYAARFATLELGSGAARAGRHLAAEVSSSLYQRIYGDH